MRTVLYCTVLYVHDESELVKGERGLWIKSIKMPGEREKGRGE